MHADLDLLLRNRGNCPNGTKTLIGENGDLLHPKGYDNNCQKKDGTQVKSIYN